MKKYKLFIFVASIFSSLVGYSIVFPDKIGLCRAGDINCIYNFPVFTVGHPLFFISLAFIFISAILMFFRDEIFVSWLKFSAFFAPLFVIFVFLAPVQTSDFITPLDKKNTAWLLSALFATISLILIAYKSIKLRGK